MYQFKNWKLICEEKDREIARLKEELERVKKLERLTKRELINGKHVGCNIEIGQMNSCPDCNDSCMYETCKWQEKANRKLKEYEDLEEQGLLLKPPCAEGTTIYMIKNNTECCSECEYFEEGCYGSEDMCSKSKDYPWYPQYAEEPACEKQFFEVIAYIPNIDWIFNNRKYFGKTVFLTKAEAEKALEEME